MKNNRKIVCVSTDAKKTNKENRKRIFSYNCALRPHPICHFWVEFETEAFLYINISCAICKQVRFTFLFGRKVERSEVKWDSRWDEWPLSTQLLLSYHIANNSKQPNSVNPILVFTFEENLFLFCLFRRLEREVCDVISLLVSSI